MTTGNFSSSYEQARSKFLSAAGKAQASVSSYQHPLSGDAQDQTLTCDVAVLGPENADTALIIVSGTHGIEGYCGSAIQHAWLMEKGIHCLDKPLKIVLVHAINPWGMKHDSRTNENNVDLNRNFIMGEYGGTNTAYSAVSPFFSCEEWDAGANLRAYRQYEAFLRKHGYEQEFEFMAGQYFDPKGFFFGGNEPQWSNTTFRNIVNETLSSSDRICIIDWHTGLGEFAEVVYLVFNEQGSEEAELAKRWWGAGNVDHSPFQTDSRPNYQGLLCQSIRQELANPKIVTAVIEFGTSDDFGTFRADRLHNWLRFKEQTDSNHDLLREDYKNLFFPRDISWRKYVEKEGVKIIERAIVGLGEWD